MKGTVLGFNAETDEGVIRGEDGKRYKFNSSQWMAESRPRSGMEVDFEIDGESAIGIYALASGLGVADKAGAVVEQLSKNENIAKAVQVGREAAANYSFSRSPVGILAAGVYAIALFMSAVSVPTGLFGTSIEFTLFDQGGGKLALLAAIGVALLYGLAKKTPGKLLALIALVLPFVVVLLGVKEMSFGDARMFEQLLELTAKSLELGFYISILAAVVMLFAPVKSEDHEINTKGGKS